MDYCVVGLILNVSFKNSYKTLHASLETVILCRS
jgi:hypothetical protein